VEPQQNRRPEKEGLGGSLNDGRIKRVAFGDEAIQNAFEELKKGRFEEKKLASFIQRAIDDLKENPLIGIKVPSKLWPKEYVRRFSINNLRKYDLPNGWRLIYTLVGNEVEIVSIILEWFPHKEYERRFKY
jgi:Txe/YoeB family toxin of Txe-Axe toxin-antitoxin module